jgi:tetratricopeptide (TPR) repeat protein
VTDRTLQQIEFLNEEIADVDAQRKAGDIDPETADRLRSRYTAELEALVASRTAQTDDAVPSSNPLARISTRSLIGIGVVGTAVLLIAIFAVASLRGSGPSGIEGVVGDAFSGEGRDLSLVSNEEMETVVAQNPDVVPMRLALARRYFEAGEFDKALDHYFRVLDREKHPEALANIGWMTYLSGYPDIAVEYVEEAVDVDPTYLTARWFLGNIYASLGRNDEAIVMLTSVVTADETPQEVKDAAVDLIRQAESS